MDIKNLHFSLSKRVKKNRLESFTSIDTHTSFTSYQKLNKLVCIGTKWLTVGKFE